MFVAVFAWVFLAACSSNVPSDGTLYFVLRLSHLCGGGAAAAADDDDDDDDD